MFVGQPLTLPSPLFPFPSLPLFPSSLPSQTFNGPSKAFDGNLLTQFDMPAQYPQWLQLNLGAQQVLSAVKIWGTNGTHSVKRVEVQVARAAGGDWTSVVNASVRTQKRWTTAKFDKPVIAQFVRIVVRSNHGGKLYAALKEVRSVPTASLLDCFGYLLIDCSVPSPLLGWFTP